MADKTKTEQLSVPPVVQPNSQTDYVVKPSVNRDATWASYLPIGENAGKQPAPYSPEWYALIEKDAQRRAEQE